uniref:Uncharacterized protein n=1 Tax=Grammatophora oceanica TaxID=210454 RepID=A0A7S1VRB4_9STRA|mmetsp:Transcript_52110/g.77810  ORF Transcript_52110/g.77810 Transcript_52110/m.77810 type:complete len:112 (+) Transcript_52110:103-438(+)
MPGVHDELRRTCVSSSKYLGSDSSREICRASTATNASVVCVKILLVSWKVVPDRGACRLYVGVAFRRESIEFSLSLSEWVRAFFYLLCHPWYRLDEFKRLVPAPAIANLPR